MASKVWLTMQYITIYAIYNYAKEDIKYETDFVSFRKLLKDVIHFVHRASEIKTNRVCEKND